VYDEARRETLSAAVIVVPLFVLAASLRLLFLFFVSGTDYTGWYHDSFHHWQIAYYTLHVGLVQNPPRMWDLGGMEYFWGLMPTLVESFLLWAFNTTKLLPFRLFNILMGSTSVVLVYLIGRRYFGRRAGLLAAILAATSPTLLEVDASGMLEPVGFACLLLALLFYEKKNYWTGFLLGLASLTHILFWFVSIAVIFSYLLRDRSEVRFVPSLLGWATPMAPYFWFIQTRTGDWLYALRWNIFGSVAGHWISDITLPLQYQIAYRAVAIGFLVTSLVAVIYVLRRRPRTYALHILFLSYIGLQSIIYGFTAYIVPYIFMGQVGRLLLDRLFAPFYYYAAFLAAAALIRVEAKFVASPYRPRLPRVRVGLKAVALFLIFLNVATYPYVVSQYYAHTYRGSYEFQTQLADQIVSQYEGGTIVTGLPIVTYWLINEGISYANVVGSLYAPSGDLTESLTWLASHNVTWIVADENMRPILEMASYGPPFHQSQNPILYLVNQTEMRIVLGSD